MFIKQQHPILWHIVLIVTVTVFSDLKMFEDFVLLR